MNLITALHAVLRRPVTRPLGLVAVSRQYVASCKLVTQADMSLLHLQVCFVGQLCVGSRKFLGHLTFCHRVHNIIQLRWPDRGLSELADATGTVTVLAAGGVEMGH